MAKFTTKEFIVPDSPSPPSTPEFPGAFTKSLDKGNIPPPALPDSLREALAREPPSSNNTSPSLYRSRDNEKDSISSSTNLLKHSPPTSSLLPDLAPQSPFGIIYGLARSPSTASIRSPPPPPPIAKSRSRTNLLAERLERATQFGDSSDTSPLLSDGSGLGFFSAGEDISTLQRNDDSPPAVPPKKSLWKAVAFGRSKSNQQLSPSRILTTNDSSLSMSRSGSTSSFEGKQLFTSPSLRRLDSFSHRNSIPNGAALEQEVEQLELQVENASARRISQSQLSRANSVAGRGIDQELDDMDLESRTDRDRTMSNNDEDRNAVPWRGSERYTHDLMEGVEDTGDESEGDDNMRTSHALIGAKSSDTLYARRRQPATDVPVAPTIFVSPSLPAPSSPDFSNSAPLEPPPNFPVRRGAPQDLRNAAFQQRSWSDGRLSTTANEQVPAEEQLAASLGLQPAQGLEGQVLDSPVISRASSTDFVIAVVGPRNVGKSTVIRRGLKRPAEKPVVILEDSNSNRVTSCTSHFNIGGQSRSVEVLEIDMALLKYNAAGLIWPDELPKCEGAMLCYDATDPRALGSLSLLLQAFWTRGSETPLIVLACKANADDTLNATDTKKAAEICNVYGAGIVALDGGIADEGKKMKNSFNWLIRTIMDNRGEPRRPSVASSASPAQSRRGSAFPVDLTTLHSRSVANLAAPPSRLLDSPVIVRPATTESPITFENPFGSTPVPPLPRQNRNDSIGSVVSTESPGYDEQIREPAPIIPPRPSVAHGNGSLDLHFSREDMIDKFLFASVTGNDEQYVTLFLIVYRRFARPYDVLSKLVERFEFVAGRLKTDPLLSRFAQMKLCGVLSTWFQAYPGDFTGHKTFDTVQAFLDGLLPRGATWVAHYAIELIPLLKSVSRMQDPENSWALPDEIHTDSLPESMPGNIRRPSLVPSFESTSSAAPSRASPSMDSSTFASSSIALRRGSDPDTIDSLPRTISTPASVDRRRDGKTQMTLLLEYSNTLLDLHEDIIAVQITRLAWDAFSEITPRDLMRHVLAPRDPKNPRSILRDSSSNVVRSINFVNYLADWIASMLLVQSKLKFRARLLEKFIAVAYSLREQENFDSLMGVLAGLNAQPIFRLSETMEVVSLRLERDKTKLPKRLRSLNKLMATIKSFAAYRIALANSGTQMLPYLGVHLQDITIVNEVKSDMRLGLVNWSKFQQMGRSAAIVLDCARLAPQLPIDRSIERCILKVPVLDKDAQYALSYNYQPQLRNGGPTTFRKLFNNALAV